MLPQKFPDLKPPLKKLLSKQSSFFQKKKISPAGGGFKKVSFYDAPVESKLSTSGLLEIAIATPLGSSFDMGPIQLLKKLSHEKKIDLRFIHIPYAANKNKLISRKADSSLRLFLLDRNRMFGQSRLSAQQKKSLLTQILLAIHELHKNNVVHRDIKLDNIFIFEQEGDYYIELGDLDDASLATEARAVGTIDSLAPEFRELLLATNIKKLEALPAFQALDKKKVDCYALSIVFEKIIDCDAAELKIFQELTKEMQLSDPKARLSVEDAYQRLYNIDRQLIIEFEKTREPTIEKTILADVLTSLVFPQDLDAIYVDIIAAGKHAQKDIDAVYGLLAGLGLTVTLPPNKPGVSYDDYYVPAKQLADAFYLSRKQIKNIAAMAEQLQNKLEYLAEAKEIAPMEWTIAQEKATVLGQEIDKELKKSTNAAEIKALSDLKEAIFPQVSTVQLIAAVQDAYAAYQGLKMRGSICLRVEKLYSSIVQGGPTSEAMDGLREFLQEDKDNSNLKEKVFRTRLAQELSTFAWDLWTPQQTTLKLR